MMQKITDHPDHDQRRDHAQHDKYQIRCIILHRYRQS